MAQEAPLPDGRSHKVVASFLVPVALEDTVALLRIANRLYPDAVIITDGPLWSRNHIIVAALRDPDDALVPRPQTHGRPEL